MSTPIRISVEGGCGIITLTRPQALNALTPEMITEVLDALHDWDGDERVRAVLIEGEGEKGFCAGGDVRQTRELAVAGKGDQVKAFFADEYEMNGLIATYRKPIMALQHGVVMGGGIGLSSHARYRIATRNARFAMPEAAIGFFSDVGVNALLYKTSQARALAFLMSGQTIAVADAIRLGLTDAAVGTEVLPGLRRRLLDAAQAGEPDTAITSVIQSESINAGAADFCALADTLEAAFAKPSAREIVEDLRDLGDDGDPGAAALYAAMSRHCPTSLVAIVLSHRLARRQRDVLKILESDLALAGHMALRPDFAEGVRAVLVDKDRTPRWDPARLADVDDAALQTALGDEGVAD